MKAIQLKSNSKAVEFTNYERIDEEELFEHVMSVLHKNPAVVIGEKQIGPSEDFYSCVISELPFILYYDIDYGTRICSDNPEALQKLIKYFNGIVG